MVYALDVSPLYEEKLSVISHDKLLSEKGVESASDDIYDDQDVENIELSKAQKHEAKVWGLSLGEEKRYVALMQNRSKFYYHGINHTPIDILGINARNDDERRKYARLAATQEILRVAKELAWNTAFTKQTEIVSNNQSVIADFDTSKYSPHNQKLYTLSDGDVLHLFLKEDDASLTLISPLIDAVHATSSSTLIIYLVDAELEDAQLWANNNGLPIEMVKTKRIIIKVGSQNLRALGLKSKQTPALLLSRQGQSKFIKLGGRNA